MKISFPRDLILNLNESLSKEYLLSNGMGGYASSTIIDCHTRKYHGLLVAPIKELNSTHLFLSKLDCSLVFEKHEHKISTNKFPGIFSPTGHQYITNFEMVYTPLTAYKIGDVILTKSYAMPRFNPTILIRFNLVEAKKPVVLKIIPLIAYRKIHELVTENTLIRPRTYFEENGFKIDPYPNLPPLYMQTSRHSIFYPAPNWWKNFEYVEERNRGYDFHEDLFSPGVFEIRLKKGDHVIIRASLSKLSASISQEWSAEQIRIGKIKTQFAKEEEPLYSLKVHAEHYFTDQHKGIIAGYHWFGEWGRDTLLSLPGITLCRNDKKTAFAILKKFSLYQKNGLLPNVISSGQNHAYNSVDTSLLFFWAVQKYIDFTGDKRQVEEYLSETLLEIVMSFIQNKTQISLLKEDGLLYAGTPQTQLTWMDATAYGAPVTSRHGAAVEINALFYNTLCFLLEELGQKLSPAQKKSCLVARENLEHNFEKLFFNEKLQCLIDVYRSEHEVDADIRPNQLFAIGLPYTCISREKALKIIDTVKLHLVTPYGLRTLSPQNSLYKADYHGDQNKRDAAYHQGMVWPWLIGIFYDAYSKVSDNKAEVNNYFLATFKELFSSHLYNNGLFHFSEIFTPNPPFTACGCIAQAWSMAEVIRILESCKRLKE